MPGSLPLEGVTVVEVAQFLAAPSATLRMRDLGARVIKIENPDGGDATRRLAMNDQMLGDSSVLFHTINRGKESLALNLKDPADASALRDLVARADVFVQNMRPGVIERLGFGWNDVHEINPRCVYGSVSGYGASTSWSSRPGQDLLAQATSGLAWLNGTRHSPPTPVGVAVCDIITGAHLAQGLLAGLVRQAREDRGMLVEVSLLESAIDLQFELITSWLNGGGEPERSEHGGHPYLAAPYGIYPTRDGFVALAMGSLEQLGDLLGLTDLHVQLADLSPTAARDTINGIVATRLEAMTCKECLDLLEPAGYWAAEVLTWRRLLQQPAAEELDLTRTLRSGNRELITTRCPIRVDGEVLCAQGLAPEIGAHDELSVTG